jgi:hypothetical protein
MRRMTSCKCQHEKDRYVPFVSAFNHALQELRKLNIAPLRAITGEGPLFHLNDPSYIQSTRGGMRKPDVVLTSLEASRTAFDPGDVAPWEDHAFRTATKRPQNSFSWEDLYLTVEFKRTRRKLPAPPGDHTYSLQKVTSIPPQILPESPYAPVEREPTAVSIEPEVMPPSGPSTKPIQSELAT